MKSDKVPDHLGGHMNKVHVDRGSLIYMRDILGCSNMLDIGCGPGWQVKLASDLGYGLACGIDGDWTVLPEKAEDMSSGYKAWMDESSDCGSELDGQKESPFFYIHDFNEKSWLPFELPYIPDKFDLAWCVEFLEHVEEQYLPNVFATFKTCRYVVMTHAVPGQDGHHHVNCQPADYWIHKFEENGFIWLPLDTERLREVSTMQKPFIKRTGMIFKNMNDLREEDYV